MDLKADKSLVTVAIPLYNQEKFISRTINSVLEQSYNHFELLVYDDASTDKSLEIVRSFDDNRIKIITAESNLGPEDNWNRCLSEINGSYYLLLPGDDILYPKYLSNLIQIYKEHEDKNIAIVSCARQVVNAKDKEIMIRSFPGLEGMYSKNDVLSKIYIHGTNVIGEPGAGLVRADIAKKVAYYQAKPGYLIDMDFWLRALEFGNLYVTKEPLCAFRISDVSWSARIGIHQRRDFLLGMRRLSKELNFRPNVVEKICVQLTSLASLVARLAFFKFIS